MIVVDASVAVKWFAIELDTPLARALLDRSERLLAPELIATEVSAALTKKVRRRLLSAEDARKHVQAWLAALAAGALILTETEGDLPASTELALELSHPLYDCLYLALAMRLDASLITADERFARGAAQRYPRVDLLGQPSAATH